MKTRLLILLGMITFVSILLIIEIPVLWMDYFSYPNVDADMVCIMNRGQWNGTGNYCDGIFDICERVGGTKISWDVTPECESEIMDTCLDVGFIRISCVFP